MLGGKSETSFNKDVYFSKDGSVWNQIRNSIGVKSEASVSVMDECVFLISGKNGSNALTNTVYYTCNFFDWQKITESPETY